MSKLKLLRKTQKKSTVTSAACNTELCCDDSNNKIIIMAVKTFIVNCVNHVIDYSNSEFNYSFNGTDTDSGNFAKLTFFKPSFERPCQTWWTTVHSVQTSKDWHWCHYTQEDNTSIKEG